MWRLLSRNRRAYLFVAHQRTCGRLLATLVASLGAVSVSLAQPPSPASLPSAQPASEKPAPEPANGSQEPDNPAPGEIAAEAPPAAPAKAVEPKSPKLLYLRYDEDYSYLDGAPGSYKPDFFDPIKNIHLGDDWRLTLGGEVRYRLEAEMNRALGATEPAQDTFNLFRYYLHADLRYRKRLRLFVQGISTFEEQRELASRAADEDRWDLGQLFVDFALTADEHPLTLRLGRRNIQYGRSRVYYSGDWSNTSTRFDGVSLLRRGERWDFDVFYLKPVANQPKQRDRFDEDYDLSGAYVTYRGIKDHAWDLYGVAQDIQSVSTSPNGRRGDRDVYTLGSRFGGKRGGFDYDAEVLGQWGHWAGDRMAAWMWALGGGYTFADVAWSPRIGASVDWGSGDASPNDGKVGTYERVYASVTGPNFGYTDVLGPQNLATAALSLSAQPVPRKLNANLLFYSFWLSEEKDAAYAGAGGALRRDPLGRSGRDVGHELNLIVEWNVDLHSRVVAGWGHFFRREYIAATGDASEDSDFFFLEYRLKF